MTCRRRSIIIIVNKIFSIIIEENRLRTRVSLIMSPVINIYDKIFSTTRDSQEFIKKITIPLWCISAIDGYC